MTFRSIQQSAGTPSVKRGEIRAAVRFTIKKGSLLRIPLSVGATARKYGLGHRALAFIEAAVALGRRKGRR